MLYIIITIITLSVLLLIALGFLFILSKLEKFHKSMFDKRFMPDKRITFYTKEEYDLTAKKYEISVDNEKIIGYLYSKDVKFEDKIIVFCHGMYSSKESYMQDMAYIALKGYYVFGFDYLGTNESSGTLLGFGNSLKSLDAVIKFIKNQKELASKKIYVIGHSWGGYAAGNIVKLHPYIKGVVLLAPLTNVRSIAEATSPKSIHKFLPLFISYDNRQTGGYSKYDICESLKDYKGKVLVIQSEIDPVISANISINRIKESLPNNDNIKYLYPKDRLHNPNYTVSAANYYMEFVKKTKEMNEEELTEYMKTCNFHKMGELDSEIMDEIVKVFEG